MLQVSTFKHALLEAGAKYQSHPFIMDDEQLGPISYIDVLSFSGGVEQQFNRLEIEPGARVAMILHNCALSALLFLAVIAARRVLVPLNPVGTRDELEYMLDRANCAAVIVDPMHAKWSNFGKRRKILISDHRAYYSERCANCNLSDFGLGDDGGASVDAGEIVFTSGSTGRPKGIQLSERSLIADASALAEVYGLSSADRFLTVCPLFHNSGQVFTTLACALVGGSTIAIRSDIGMFHFWSYVDRYQPNWSLGMVSFLALLLSRPEAPIQPCSMRGLLTGGSVIDAALVQRFESRFRVPVRTIYGLTETASISTCEFRDPSPRSLGSSGRPLPICDVRIGTEPELLASSDDPRSRVQGEIWISGQNVFDAYIEDPDLTQRRKRDGWLQTGDLGYFDENGNLFVVDRLDSMLIVGGENVYPAEIEKSCTLLPCATQVVLGAADHPIWGKELILVYKAEGADVPPLRAWHRILSEQVAAFKLPKRYVAVQELGLSEFPRKENGKLDRQAIAGLLRRKFRNTP